MPELTIDQQAELLVRDAAAQLTGPQPGECVICFVARMLDEFGCDTSLRFALRYRDLVAPLATGLERRLGAMGGYCDCEIFLNGVRLGDHLLEHDEFDEPVAPDPVPRCGGVRRGSTRSCANWVRRRAGW